MFVTWAKIITKEKQNKKPQPATFDYIIWGNLLIIIQEMEAMEGNVPDNSWEFRLSSKERILLEVYRCIILATV